MLSHLMNYGRWGLHAEYMLPLYLHTSSIKQVFTSPKMSFQEDFILDALDLF